MGLPVHDRGDGELPDLRKFVEEATRLRAIVSTRMIEESSGEKIPRIGELERVLSDLIGFFESHDSETLARVLRQSRQAAAGLRVMERHAGALRDWPSDA